MDDNFSSRVKDVITYSKEEAIRLGHDFIGTEHLLLGILRDGGGKAIKILNSLDIDLDFLRKKIEILSPPNPIINYEENLRKNLHLTRQAERALKTTFLEAKLFQGNSINTAHLLLCILRNENDPTTKLLEKLNLSYDIVKDQFKEHISESNDNYEDITSSQTFDDEQEDDENPIEQNPFNVKQNSNKTKKSKTPVLDNFGRDLTLFASEGKLDPIIGRHKEIERVSQILSRRKKNNPLLIGEPGVGKSAIAEGLALRIVERKVSRLLYNKRVISLDLASVVAGTKYRGQFEERMKAVMNEIEKNKDIILFIDEIHTIVGAGGAMGSLDASNMFKPALARGEIQCIGATTLDEYRKYIEKDGALERRFQKIIVEPTSVKETIQILQDIKHKYEDHHNVKYTDDAIEACVKLTERYINDRNLPDKAIDAMDEAGSRVHITNMDVPKEIVDLENKLESVRIKKNSVVKNQKYEEAARLRDDEKKIEKELLDQQKMWDDELKKKRELVSEDNIIEVVSLISGVPLRKIDQTENVIEFNLERSIKDKIIGQDDAVDAVVNAIQRNKTGLKDPNKPIGSFIFLGQTGIGKTQLAKSLGEELFNNKDSLIRIDMSEYMEKFSVSRLIGAPPGYVGYEEGGQLSERVRRKPYSVVLLDEIEKAHPDVFNMLLQVLDDGYLTDSVGRKVDFKNTVIIMTSNIGTRKLKEFGTGVGFDTDYKRKDENKLSSEVLKKSLSKKFSPEFLNRIDEIVVFNQLSSVEIEKIAKIEISNFVNRLKEIDYDVKIDNKVYKFISVKGFDKEFGARPIKRAIQKYLEDPLAKKIVNSEVKKGDKIEISHKSNSEALDIKITSK
ncbi:MAG: ATP-dependent Clp protease ClpC [Flavobacteriales bacterium]|jgi:ATP-dependent Clp protease ATP-binding subunit ClpC|nr:MAG: ATP-dependent Clp protease ClpC [Flavobacteriales bacterium]|tara:strand:- start:2718 stop:5255 length:2538 start_codon:yes stop_codon:yes gene_type:complete